MSNIRIILFNNANIAQRQTLPIEDRPPYTISTIVWVKTDVVRLDITAAGDFSYANTSGYVREGYSTGQIVYKV